jgi:ectoine hydroxylase-related dioxygenase (phytanoyl-CoA dioxygenase family)
MSEFTSAHAAAVRTDGFTIVEGAFDTPLAERMRGLLAHHAEQQHREADPRRAIDDYMVHNLMVLEDDFMQVLANPCIVAALDELLGATSLVYAYTSSSMPAGGTNYSHRVHVDCPRVIPGYPTNVGVIVALDDFTTENGATYFLPGSFERTTPPTEDEFFANAVRVYPRRGDIVVFNARTWHLGGMNTTDRDRHALTLNACRSYMRQRFDYPRMIEPEVAAVLSPVLRRLLGFDVRVPTSLDEYYLPEEQRLYKAGQG